MSFNSISVDVEGDYVSSFIYSGILFLVDFDFFLRAYSWVDVAKSASSGYDGVDGVVLNQFLENSVRNDIPKKNRSQVLTVSQRSLNRINSQKINLGVWPSDINIYKNRFYVSSETGVVAYDFNWDGGRVRSFSDPLVIWNEASFGISTNTLNRLAIASGDDGVLSFIPTRKYVSDNDVNQLIDAVCVDCDWQGDRLIANTIDGVDVLDFQSIPDYELFKGKENEYWGVVNRIKTRPPEKSKIKSIGSRNVISSWIAGEKEFFLLDDSHITFRNIDELVSGEANLSSELNSVKLPEGQILATRTASFGTVVQSADSLFFFNDRKMHNLSDNLVAWRVFPRARNYANHLHIVRDQCVSIMMVEVDDNSNSDITFGFSPDFIDDL